MANANAIPEDADKIVFAFDVFNYIMEIRNPRMSGAFNNSSIPNTVENFRGHAHTVFDDRMKEECSNMNETQEHQVRIDFEDIMEKNSTLSIECLINYGDVFRESCLGAGFHPRRFLMYCTRIAAMACFFFARGVREAPEIGVNLIVSALPHDPNFNWANFDFGNERRMHTDESSDSMNQYYLRREQANVISSETEESSNDSISICDSDSALTDKFHQREGSSETQSTSVITHKVVEELTAGIGELSVSNFENTCDITEQSGISSLSPGAVSGSNLSPRALSGSNLSPRALSGSNHSPRALSGSNHSPRALSGSNHSPRALSGSSLSPRALSASNLSPRALSASNLSVPVTRSSSVSPRKRPFPKENIAHLQQRNLSDELSKPTSSLGKRRSTGNDDSVSSDIPESAAEKDETAEDVSAPSESKKPKFEENDEK